MCLHSEDIFCKSSMMKSESHTIILRIRYYHSWRARIFAFLWDFTETLYKKVTKLKNNNPGFTQKSITCYRKAVPWSRVYLNSEYILSFFNYTLAKISDISLKYPVFKKVMNPSDLMNNNFGYGHFLCL